MFTSLTRDDQLKHMESITYDIVVIGGGITGAGIALDAAKRGMNVALVEMQDFAEGTSSRSTKLVHGGLRYLKQYQFGVVKNTGRERAIVYENGPHVTTPEWMLLPLHVGGTFGKFSTSIGLRLYDMLAEVKKSEHRKMLSREEVIEKEPLVRQEKLLGGGYYVEYRTDDARLTIDVLKRAVDFGADPINYMKATSIVYDNGKVVGIRAVDVSDTKTVGSNESSPIALAKGQKEYQILGRTVINATGPWVDDVRKLDNVADKGKKELVHTKGVHIVFDQSIFPLSQAVYYDTRSDGRMIFAVPRDGKTYVGTTDTFFDGDLRNPVATKEDREYLLDTANYMFPGLNLTESHIESSWAGIRPLISNGDTDNASDISRKDEIWESNTGLITIAGGKLTGYRHMAEEIVDRAAQRLKENHQLTFKKGDTKKQPISGGDVGGSANFESYVDNYAKRGPEFGLTEAQARRLVERYGSNIEHLFTIALASKGVEKEYDLPLDVYAEVLYSVQFEMILKPNDYFVRRTGDMYFNINRVKAHKENVMSLLKDVLDWNDSQYQQYLVEVNDEIKHAEKYSQ